MNKSLLKIIKATILSLIVAFLFTFIICFSLVMIGKEKFDMAIYLLNIVTVDEDNVQTITPVLEGNVCTLSSSTVTMFRKIMYKQLHQF